MSDQEQFDKHFDVNQNKEVSLNEFKLQLQNTEVRKFSYEAGGRFREYLHNNPQLKTMIQGYCSNVLSEDTTPTLLQGIDNATENKDLTDPKQLDISEEQRALIAVISLQLFIEGKSNDLPAVISWVKDKNKQSNQVQINTQAPQTQEPFHESPILAQKKITDVQIPNPKHTDVLRNTETKNTLSESPKKLFNNLKFNFSEIGDVLQIPGVQAAYDKATENLKTKMQTITETYLTADNTKQLEDACNAAKINLKNPQFPDDMKKFISILMSEDKSKLSEVGTTFYNAYKEGLKALGEVVGTLKNELNTIVSENQSLKRIQSSLDIAQKKINSFTDKIDTPDKFCSLAKLAEQNPQQAMEYITEKITPQTTKLSYSVPPLNTAKQLNLGYEQAKENDLQTKRLDIINSVGQSDAQNFSQNIKKFLDTFTPISLGDDIIYCPKESIKGNKKPTRREIKERQEIGQAVSTEDLFSRIQRFSGIAFPPQGRYNPSQLSKKQQVNFIESLRQLTPPKKVTGIEKDKIGSDYQTNLQKIQSDNVPPILLTEEIIDLGSRRKQAELQIDTKGKLDENSLFKVQIGQDGPIQYLYNNSKDRHSIQNSFDLPHKKIQSAKGYFLR